jgi:hypothetical protein
MPTVREVKWGEDNSLNAAPVLSEEEQYAIRARMAALDKLLEREKKAKYKLELMFGKARSVHRPTPGILSFWESGSKFHGGGDAKIYICPGKELRRNDCEGFIPDVANGYGFLVCPNCKLVWKGDQVIGEVVANLPLKKWADPLMKYFIQLGLNCDVYLKYARDDIRTAAKLEQQKQMKGDKLLPVRASRASAIYPLRNIIKDTGNGADLLGRFQAFLLA